MKRSRTFLCFLAFGSLFLLCAPLRGGEPASDKSYEHVPWIDKLPTIRADTRTTSFRARRRHVVAGRDTYVSEKYDEEIEKRLGRLSALLTTQPFDPASVTELLHPDFKGAPLSPASRALLREPSPAVWKLEPQAALTVDAANLGKQLQWFMTDGFALRQAKLKVVGITVESDNPKRVRTRIWYDIVGRSGPAVREQIGHWQFLWEQQAGAPWLLRQLLAESAYLSQASQPFFTDITEAALGEGPASRQLRHGLEYWTLQVDASFAMSDEGYSGIAIGDVDGDGREDFYVAQPAALPNRLFLNRGDGRFTEAAAAAGVDLLDDTAASLLFDYDNDGDSDLLLIGHGGPLLFSNQGAGRFTLEDSQRNGLVRAGQLFNNPMSICAADYNADGRLDFYVTSYQLQYDDMGLATHPLPYHDAQNGPPNFLYRNNGDGTFTEATAETRLDQNNNRFSYACAWGDYDNDGYPDLYVANDFGRNNLYRNNGDGTFADVAARAGVEDIAAGMSAAWEDYDNDGWLDLYVGNMWSSAGLRVTSQEVFRPDSAAEVQTLFRRHAKGNTLFRNRGDGTFEDVTERAGVALGRWAWGSDFLDVDSDGREDIFVVNGFLTNESSQDL